MGGGNTTAACKYTLDCSPVAPSGDVHAIRLERGEGQRPLRQRAVDAGSGLDNHVGAVCPVGSLVDGQLAAAELDDCVVGVRGQRKRDVGVTGKKEIRVIDAWCAANDKWCVCVGLIYWA